MSDTLTVNKSSTLAETMASMAAEQQSAEVSDVAVNEQGTLTESAAQVETSVQTDTNATVTTEADNEPMVTDFNLSEFNGTEDTTQKQETISDWRDAIKKADKKEILKELGFDDFSMEFAEYRKNGGDAYKYLEAKSLDWNKVSDTQLLMDSLREKYPNMSDEERQDYFNYKYKQGEYDNEDDKKFGSLTLKAEASDIRQRKIEEQQRFKVPIIEQQKPSAEQIAAEQKQKEENEKIIQYVNNHESTKMLLDSKRVAIKLPDGIKPFNYNVDPKVVIDALYNPDASNKYGKLKTGEPDVQLAYELALFKMNPEQFKRDLINIGKGIGHRKEVEEAQNIQKPNSTTQVDLSNETLKETFATKAQSGTLAKHYGIGN